jgi:glycerol-3-phosphate acyltransferase PlsY
VRIVSGSGGIVNGSRAADETPAACYEWDVEPFSSLLQHHTLATLAWCAAGFASGSIPFGLILALLVGKTDVRTRGSGNIGATNVARVVGRKLGVVTLVLDALKGALPALAVELWPPAGENSLETGLLGGLVGLAALLGHCFTPWLRFKGGKGVATGLGVLLALHPEVAAYGLGAFAVAFLASRIVSVSSLSAAVVVVAALFVLGPVDVRLLPMLACLVVIVARHGDNIRRLRRREELSL